MPAMRRMFMELVNRKIQNPVVLITDSNWQTTDEHLIHYSTECGALFLDGFGDGICLGMTTRVTNIIRRNAGYQRKKLQQQYNR
jgi:(E)-4-hydroxy-3-methylbut-2-enyl-diphosphate synthase